MKRFYVAAVLVCLGCNQSIPIGDDPLAHDPQGTDDTGSSGTRLKRRVITTADGGKQAVGWFDVERQEACAFRAGPDGVQRCMPTELVSDRLGIRSSDLVLYTESTCSEAVYVARVPRTGECNERLRYIFQSPESLEDCPGDYYYAYKIGEATTLGGGTLYIKRESGCHIFNPQSTDYVYSAAQVPASAFVAAELSIE